MQGDPFLSTAPEPFLVQRAKRIRGIFSTLLTIFLGPTGWKLQCSYSSFHQGKAGSCWWVACATKGVRGTRGTLHWWLKGLKGFRALAWPPGDEQQNRPPRKLMASALCWWSLLVTVLLAASKWEWRREYLCPSLWGWRKWENLTKVWRRETETCLRFSSWTVLGSVSFE